MYYWTCSRCGANLDPGEHCDCENEETPERLPNTTGVITGYEYPLNNITAIIADLKEVCQHGKNEEH